MSGHSKWNNIKRKKEKTDGAKAKIFTKIGREIAVAVKSGGGDSNVNGKLRDLIAKAKANNVPNDNIDRIIKKAMGDGDKNNYENIVYEGYGPNGVAVIVECLTDNRNRTAGDVRHVFDKFGGNLGTTGCVSFGFQEKGVFVINNEDGEYDEDKIMEDVMDAGAEDFSMEEDMVEITCAPADFSNVLSALEEKGYTFETAEVQQVPNTYVSLTDEDSMKKMALLLEKLEDNDDVQNVWHNWENEADLIDFLAYQKQGILSQRFHVYHTLEGIRSFLDTGKLHEIPEGLYHPFSPEDRRLLVSRMLENPAKNYQLLRGPLQFLPHNFHLYVSPSGGYLLFTNRLNQTVYLLFEEQSLLALFLDYLNHIDVKYLYSCEQMQNLVKNQLFFRT